MTRVARPPGPAMERRTFLKLSTMACGGLLVTITLPACRTENRGPAARVDLNGFVALDTHGRVTISIPAPEIGQGIRTALAMLVAEELGARWEDVRVEQADAGPDIGPWPLAGGSNSVRLHWIPFREAGALARQALIEAAASRWGVDERRVRVVDGEARMEGARRRLAIGELASEAAALEGVEVPPLKPEADFHRIGRPTRSLDASAIVRGTMGFGLDVRVPGMLRAVVARPPEYGATLRRWDAEATLRVPGVRAVVPVPPGDDPERPAPRGGLAVVAESTWAAVRGRELLEIEWAAGPNARESTEALHRRAGELLRQPAPVYRGEGAVEEALEEAVTRVSAEYHAPFLAHAPLEPMNCVVKLGPDQCEIWAPTQVPNAIQIGVAGALGLPRDAVRVNVIRAGGGFGRRLLGDFVLEALPIARAVDAPIQVIWTRDDDMRHGYYRPFSRHRLEAGLDPSGRPISWLHRLAGTSRYGFQRRPAPAASEFGVATWPGTFVGAHRLEFADLGSNLPIGSLRAPGANSYRFVTESFLDEVAHAAQRDPLDLRMDLLTPDLELPHSRDFPAFSTNRMRGVLQRVAMISGWGSAPPQGRGRGIACGFDFGSYVAQALEASVDPSSGEIHVHHVWAAIDCGHAVNPNGIRAQVEGSIIDGLGCAKYGEITFEGGRVMQSNFHDYPLLRFSEAPRVVVEIVRSDAPPTGMGEPAYPPVFAALANAVFAASGVRLRELPFRPERVREQLART